MILLHYPLDLSHIQWELIDVVTSLIGAITTIIITILTLKTVREMKKEREQSLRPNFIMETDSKFIVWKDKSLDDFRYFANSESEGINYLKLYNHEIEMYNIGLGTAKYIDVEYSFDNDKMIKVLESKGIKVGKLDIENPSFKADYLTYNPGISTGKKDMKFRKVFISPSQESFQIPLPKIYLCAFSTYLLAGRTIDLLKISDFYKEFPTLNLHIEYYDIGLKKYPQDFQIKFTFSGSSRDYVSCIIHTRELNDGKPI